MKKTTKKTTKKAVIESPVMEVKKVNPENLIPLLTKEQAHRKYYSKKIEVPVVHHRTLLMKNFGSENNEKEMLGAVVAGVKKAILRAGGGKKKLTPEGRKSRATKALTSAMMRRQWVDEGNGMYTLNSVSVNTKNPDFTVDICDRKVNKTYSLALGKGAIRELDSYMSIR